MLLSVHGVVPNNDHKSTKIPLSEMVYPFLDFWVARVMFRSTYISNGECYIRCPYKLYSLYKPSIWNVHGKPIIDHFHITTEVNNGNVEAYIWEHSQKKHLMSGKTVLIAAMRCFVDLKYNEYIRTSGDTARL